MRDEAERRIGHLYPDATGPNGEKLTPIAWIWARTVESPDPAWSGHVPLVASWVLANKPGKPKVWIEPAINRETQTISYDVRKSDEPTRERTVQRGNGVCIATGSAISGDYIKARAELAVWASGCWRSWPRVIGVESIARHLRRTSTWPSQRNRHGGQTAVIQRG